MRWAAIIALAFAASLSSPALAGPIGEHEAAKLPIFDAHIHYKEPAWEAFPPETVLKLMDRNGVAMGLVSSTPDEGTIVLWEHAPDRIVPELRPYLGDWGSSNWTEYDGMADYIEDRLAKYPHRGIGEFHVRAMETTNRGLLKLIAGMRKSETFRSTSIRARRRLSISTRSTQSLRSSGPMRTCQNRQRLPARLWTNIQRYTPIHRFANTTSSIAPAAWIRHGKCYC